MPDGQPRQPRRAAPQTKRRGQQTTANAPPLPAAGQNDGSKAAESWQLYTVWARWSAASVRMWGLLQQLVRDRAVQVPVIGLRIATNAPIRLIALSAKPCKRLDNTDFLSIYLLQLPITGNDFLKPESANHRFDVGDFPLLYPR